MIEVKPVKITFRIANRAADEFMRLLWKLKTGPLLSTLESSRLI